MFVYLPFCAEKIQDNCVSQTFSQGNMFMSLCYNKPNTALLN